MGKKQVKFEEKLFKAKNAKVKKWLIETGDDVVVDDPILLIETSKEEIVIKSTASGELKEKRIQEGDLINIGDVFAEIENEDEDEDEDEDEIDEGESNLDNELNTNTKNIAETGGSFILKYRIVYFILSIAIIVFTIWFFLKLDIETDQNKELKVSKEEVEVSLPPEQIITPPTEKIIKSEKKKIEPPKKPKKRNAPKVNKIEKKNSEEKDYKDDCLDKEVAFSEIEDVPIFPGCEKVKKSELKNCFQEQMNNHIRRNFRYQKLLKNRGYKGGFMLILLLQRMGKLQILELVDLMKTWKKKLLE